MSRVSLFCSLALNGVLHDVVLAETPCCFYHVAAQNSDVSVKYEQTEKFCDTKENMKVLQKLNSAIGNLRAGTAAERDLRSFMQFGHNMVQALRHEFALRHTEPGTAPLYAEKRVSDKENGGLYHNLAASMLESFYGSAVADDAANLNEVYDEATLRELGGMGDPLYPAMQDMLIEETSNFTPWYDSGALNDRDLSLVQFDESEPYPAFTLGYRSYNAKSGAKPRQGRMILESAEMLVWMWVHSAGGDLEEIMWDMLETNAASARLKNPETTSPDGNRDVFSLQMILAAHQVLVNHAKSDVAWDRQESSLIVKFMQTLQDPATRNRALTMIHETEEHRIELRKSKTAPWWMTF